MLSRKPVKYMQFYPLFRKLLITLNLQLIVSHFPLIKDKIKTILTHKQTGSSDIVQI